MNRAAEPILIVDDNDQTRSLLVEQLQRLGHQTVQACNGAEALNILDEASVSVLLLDVQMPGVDGIEVLNRMNDQKREIPVVIISGSDASEVVRETLRASAYDFLTKPWDIDDLGRSVKRAVDYRTLAVKNREYRLDLETKVQERTTALQNALVEIRKTYQETILALGSALETRDVETKQHALRVARYSERIACAMGTFSEEAMQSIRWGAFLHDIGKIGVPDTILRKPSPLTENEWAIMKLHPEIGRRMVENIHFLGGTVPIIYSHHERFDGRGYPSGLIGDTIPIEARIFAIADAFDAMVSDRPYRNAMDL